MTTYNINDICPHRPYLSDPKMIHRNRNAFTLKTPLQLIFSSSKFSPAALPCAISSSVQISRAPHPIAAGVSRSTGVFGPTLSRASHVPPCQSNVKY